MKNKIKSKKGITMVSLVITIVVMLILVSAIVLSTDFAIKSTNKKDFSKEIYQIQNLIKVYKVKNSKLPVTSDVTIDINEIPIDSKSDFSDEQGFDTGTVILKEIDLNELGVEDAKLGYKKEGEKDFYAISEATNKVYYVAGKKIGNTVYYTLNDELKKQIGVSK